MRKKLISLILTAVMMISLIPVVAVAEEYSVETLLYSENFESYTVGTKPQMDVYESTSSIAVAAVGSTKALHIKNINGISNATVEKKIDRIEKKPVDVTVKFMQTQTGSSNNKVIELRDGDKGFAVYANAGAFYMGEKKLCDYPANKWQTVKLKIDFYKSLVDVYVNGSLVAEDVAIETVGADKLVFSASQSPGFYIDDISVKSTQTVSEMYIDGNDTLVIPRNGENEYKFSAYCKDENGERITVSNIDWLYSPADYQGITVAETDGGVLIKVESAVSEGAITVTASLDGGAYSKIKTVHLKKVAPTDIRIDGDSRIAGENGKTYRYGYEVAMNDQNGETVENYGDFTWSMNGLNGYTVPSYITLDSDSGIITVTAETPFREFIELKAVSNENPDVWQKKKVLVTDFDSLIYDNMRYDAVKTHIDNVMEYAKDPYDDTPLLTDVINLNAKAPGAVIIKTGEPIITSNISVQSTLMRSMVNLSNFENDDTYRQKVKDIYEYTMDISPEHYLIEGGHMAVDLKTKSNNPNSQSTQGLHETKGGFTYWTPLFWVDYDRAEILIKALFSGHSGMESGGVSAKNMQLARHWYTGKSSITAENADVFWSDTSLYDWDRRGAVLELDIVNFLITYGEMFALLAQYYEAAATQEEKDEILAWADIIYSSLDQTGYDPLTGEYTGMFNETNGSKYKPDWSNIYDTWGKYGRHWYDLSNKSSSMVPGDRFLTNTVIGDRDIRPVSEGGEGFGPSSDGKSWVNTHYDPDPYKGVNEENWMYFLEPYMFTRENSCITSVGPGLFLLCDALPEDSPLKNKIIEKYTNSIYNYLNLRYNWSTSHFDAKMSWGLDVTDWRYPHFGYYASEGSKINGKVPENALIQPLAMLVYEAVELAERTDLNETATNTYPDKKRKEQLMEQAEYIWSVLRNLCKVNFMLGDIGDPFNGIPADVNLATTSTSVDILQGVLRIYQLYNDESFLKLASNIANNIMATQYNAGTELFGQGPILITTANRILPIFLELEAVLLDDYDRLIEADLYSLPAYYWDVEYITDHGVKTNGIFLEQLGTISEPGVKQQMLLIEDPFTMKVGESRKITYSVLPYDAPTGVLWNVSDPEIADISTSGVITAHKSGTVDICCVSSSVKGLKSKTITVTVK